MNARRWIFGVLLLSMVALASVAALAMVAWQSLAARHGAVVAAAALHARRPPLRARRERGGAVAHGHAPVGRASHRRPHAAHRTRPLAAALAPRRGARRELRAVPLRAVGARADAARPSSAPSWCCTAMAPIATTARSRSARSARSRSSAAARSAATAISRSTQRCPPRRWPMSCTCSAPTCPSATRCRCAARSRSMLAAKTQHGPWRVEPKVEGFEVAGLDTERFADLQRPAACRADAQCRRADDQRLAAARGDRRRRRALLRAPGLRPASAGRCLATQPAPGRDHRRREHA